MIYTYVYIHTFICICIFSKEICIYVYIYVYKRSPKSCIQHSTNSIQHPPKSSVPHSTNSIQHSTNSIQHSTNSIQHPPKSSVQWLCMEIIAGHLTFHNFCHRRQTMTAHVTALFGAFFGPIFGPGFALFARVFQGGRKRGHGRDSGEGWFGGEALKRREGIAMRKRVLEEEDGCTTLRCRSAGGEGGRVDVVSLLFELSRLGVRSVMVEGGAEVIQTFLSAGVSNYIVITIAPLFLGGLPALQSKYASGGRHASEEGEGKSSRATSGLVLPPVHEPTFLHVGRDIVLTFTCGLEKKRATRERDGGGGGGD